MAAPQAVIPASEPFRYSEIELSKASKERYFSQNPQELKACEVRPEDIDMRRKLAKYVAEVYAQYGYLAKQPHLVIPDNVPVEDIYDKTKTEELVERLVKEQHGNKGVRKFQKGVVFVAENSHGEVVGLIDAHEKLQDTFVVSLGSEDILYTVRIIHKNGHPLPIQSLAKWSGHKPPIIVADSPEHKKMLKEEKAELSQFATSTQHIHTEHRLFRIAKQVALNYLFGIVFSTEKARDITHFAATYDKEQFNAFNNINNRDDRPDYDLTPLGEAAFYMNSWCVPCDVDPAQIIESVAQTHPDLAKILAGNFGEHVIVDVPIRVQLPAKKPDVPANIVT